MVMKPAIFALILFPLAVYAQAKPGVASVIQAAKRAWESAPAEKKMLWQQQREALQHIDLSEDTSRQIVIARGTPEDYHAHHALLSSNEAAFLP